MKPQTHTRRFFVADMSGDEIQPDPGEVHHALRVLRLKDEDQVELFDGAGGVATGRIRLIGRRNLVIRIAERRTEPRPPGPAIHLASAAPKGKRADWLAEKAAELGAASLQRVIFERSSPAAKIESDAKSDKLAAHCISAAKQSGLNFLPQLPPPATLGEILSRNKNALRLLGDLEPDAISLAGAIESNRPFDEIVLLIGPEGGLTETERSESIASGFIPVRIARTILRTETAAVAILASVVAATYEQ
jgi:16S rRNA (uracil1498-N3)-methyltransferase